MIRTMESLGYRPQLIGEFHGVDGLEQFIPYEEALAEGSPVMLTLKFDRYVPWEVVYSIEDEISTTDVGRILDHFVYREADDPTTIHVVYAKGIAIGSIIVGILILVGIPILLGGLAFALFGDTIKQIINLVVTLGVMMLMMKIMGSAIEDKKKPEPLPPPPPTPPYPLRHPYAPTPAPKPPVEQRIADRVESIANSIARIDAAFRRSDREGTHKVVRTSSDIGSVARDLNRVPETQMTRSDKAQVYDRLSSKQRGLVEQYEEKLTPRQRQILQEERQIVEELKAMHD